MKLANDNEIVLVDDDEVDAHFFKRCLETSELQNQFLFFDCGRLFLDHMANVRAGVVAMPALVLLDINMPGLSGFDVLEELRNYEEFKSIPIVALYTNSDSTRDKARAERLNADFKEKFSSRADGVSFLNSLAHSDA